MSVEGLLGFGFMSLLAGALITALAGDRGQRRISPLLALVAVLAASMCFVTVAVEVLAASAGQSSPGVELWRPSFVNAVLSVRVDALSAFFLLVISTVSSLALWYAVAYTRNLEGLRWFYPPLLLFVAGMAGVVVIDDFLFFFVPWEFMTLNSYVLVIFHRERKESLDAGFKYFVVTQAGAVALLFGVVWLAVNGGGSFRFDDMSRAMPSLLAAFPVLTHVALALILVGFLTKTGAFPFGMWWLPDAHPAAPSPVSALLSGVMIKLGLYGILRVFLDILPPGAGSRGWGIILASVGVLSLFFGTLRALVQHDSKRLLAYSSIGQVGYMLLGFGIGLGLSQTNSYLAAIALVGGLFHVLNHALFKGLLFLNAGTLELATGERDLNRMGGLSAVLPLTAVCMVVASFSIAGLPPFNGFASKWLLYHASIWTSGTVGVLFLAYGVVAVFISAVTLAIFVKFMGATIWGTPAGPIPPGAVAKEGIWLGGSQAVLGLACVALGLLPHAGAWLCYRSLDLAIVSWNPPAYSSLFGNSPFRLALSDGTRLLGAWFPLGVGGILLAAFGLGELIHGSAGANRRQVQLWKCGSRVGEEETRFRADHYYVPFQRFVCLVAPELKVGWRPRRWPIVPRVLNPDGWAFEPFVSRLLACFRRLAASRAGLPQVYPAWNLIGLTLSLVVLFVLWWSGGFHNV